MAAIATLILFGGIFIIGAALIIAPVVGSAFLCVWLYRRFIRPEIRREMTLQRDLRYWEDQNRR